MEYTILKNDDNVKITIGAFEICLSKKSFDDLVDKFNIPAMNGNYIAYSNEKTTTIGYNIQTNKLNINHNKLNLSYDICWQDFYHFITRLKDAGGYVKGSFDVQPPTYAKEWKKYNRESEKYKPISPPAELPSILNEIDKKEQVLQSLDEINSLTKSLLN